MDKYMNIYKSAIEAVTAPRDITDRAKRRIAEPSKAFLLRHIAAAACAVTVMGGLSVYAVHNGWLDSLFGSSSSAISENISDYAVSVGDRIVNNEDDSFPYYISLGDVICDGTMIYGELYFTDKTGAAINRDTANIEADIYYNGDNSAPRESGFIFLNENEDGSAVGAFYSVFKREIAAGDSVNVDLEYYDSPFHQQMLGSASLSFGIADMPRTLAVHYDINKPAKITSRNGVTAEVQINDMTISPLRLEMNGLSESYANVRAISDSGEYSINFSDGSYLYIENRVWKLNTDASGGSVMAINDCYCDSYSLGSAQRLEDGSYAFDIEVPFRCVLPVDEIKSVSVGDIEISVNE